MLSIPKGYFHDRILLVLFCTKLFVASLGIILILLRLGGGNNTYIVQYRSNLGLDAFTSGTSSQFVLFIGAIILITVLNTFISLKTYPEHRPLSILSLSGGIFLLLLVVIVSNALLQVVR